MRRKKRNKNIVIHKIVKNLIERNNYYKYNNQKLEFMNKVVV